MRTNSIDKMYYENREIGGPIVIINSIHPKIDEIELPLACAKPRMLTTPSGKVVEYLIDYKPWMDNDQDNVEMTRHCYYVDRETWLNVKKMRDSWKGSSK